jgi:hypothetical protein
VQRDSCNFSANPRFNRHWKAVAKGFSCGKKLSKHFWARSEQK